MKAKTNPIKWKKVNESLFTLNCPICGAVWQKAGEGFIDPCDLCSPCDPCKHLKFRLIKGCKPAFFDQWYHDDFDIFEVLDGKKNDDVDMIFLLEESGVGCGPVSKNVWYGVKK